MSSTLSNTADIEHILKYYEMRWSRVVVRVSSADGGACSNIGLTLTLENPKLSLVVMNLCSVFRPKSMLKI